MDQNDTGFVCSSCNKNIKEGETMWSVNVHHEVFKHGAITVLEADSKFVFCDECAGLRDFSRVIVPVKYVKVH